MQDKANTWKQIWENKGSQLDTHLAPEEILKQLFVLTGFDSKSSSGLNVQNYRDFIRRVFEWAKLEDCESLYEVGCGAGAFLYAMSLEKNTKNGGGYYTLVESTMRKISALLRKAFCQMQILLSSKPKTYPRHHNMIVWLLFRCSTILRILRMQEGSLRR